MTRVGTGTVLTERAFDPSRDLPGMVELIADVNRFDGIPWFPTVAGLEVDLAGSPTFNPVRDMRLVAAGDRIVAAAGVDWRERAGKVIHTVEIWVHPDSRRQGIGRRLLAWSEDRARESVAHDDGGPAALPHFLGIGTGAHVLPGTAFAEAHGYPPIRYSFGMRRDLREPIAEVAMPAGLELRPVSPDQHRRIWDADVEAFRDHWEPATRNDTDFEHHFGHPTVDTTMWLVAWDGDEVAGSVQNGIYPEENAQLGIKVGWLDHVSVRRPWRNRGLASALIVRSLGILRERGMDWASLGVDAENPTGALGLYERFGFRVFQTWVKYRKPL